MNQPAPGAPSPRGSSPAATGFRPAWLLWASPILVALALGKYAKPPVYVIMSGRRVPSPVTDRGSILYQLGVGSVAWYAVLFASPLLLLGARRLGTGRGKWLRNALLIGGTLGLGIGATLLIDYLVTFSGIVPRPRLSQFAMMGLRRDALPWVALFGTVAAIEWRRRAVQAEIERERLRAEASEQRLLALMAQVRPHFLFNTLQAISTLLHRDPRAADEMLGRLSDLLRSVLEHRGRAFVPFSEEIRLTVAYLEIARTRLGERLSFEVDVPPETQGIEIPLFILQPLVENALTHGIGRRMSGGQVTIRARRAGDRLRVEVEDDGPGLANGGPREGIGLPNTRERLQESFGEDQAFGLVRRSSGQGVLAFVEVPWRAYRGEDDAP